MYIPNDDKNKLTDAISRLGASAVTLLAEEANGEACHPDTYCAGYLQGYAHAVDAACHIVEHCTDLK